MISITIGNKVLRVKPGTQMSLEHHNMMFDDEIAQGEFMLPATLPYKENAEHFGFLHGLHRIDRIKIYGEAKLRYKKWPFVKGILDVLSVTDREIVTSVRANISGLTCITKRLRELDLGGDRYVDILPDTAKEKSITVDPENEFCFPMIYNPGFYLENNADFEGYVNFFTGGEYQINTSENKYNMCPMVYLHYLIKQGFAEDGYTVLDTEFMADLAMKKLIVYNNYALDAIERVDNTIGLRATTTTKIPVTVNSGEWSFKPDNDTTTGNFDALSAYNPVTGEYTIQSAGVHVITMKPKVTFDNHPQINGINTVTCRMFKAGVLIQQSVNSYAGTVTVAFPGFTFTHVTDPADVGQPITMTIEFTSLNTSHHMFTVAGGVLSVNDFYETENVNIYSHNINLTNHVPDITFGEMISALRNVFFFVLKFDYSLKTVELVYDNTSIKSAPRKIEQRIVTGHKIEFNDSGVIRSLNFDFNGDDELEKTNFKTYDESKYLGQYTDWDEVNTLMPPVPAIAGNFCLLLDVNQIFKVINDGGTLAWRYYTDAFYEKVVNPAGKVDLRPNVRPMMMRQQYWDDSGTERVWRTPQILQKGSSPEFDQGENNFAFRLMFFEGIVDAGYSEDYPYAHTSIPIPGAVPTSLTDPEVELFETALFWRNYGLLRYGNAWIELTSTGEFIIKNIRLDLVELLRFDIAEKLRINEANFIIKDMKVTLNERQIEEAEYTLLHVLT